MKCLTLLLVFTSYLALAQEEEEFIVKKPQPVKLFWSKADYINSDTTRYIRITDSLIFLYRNSGKTLEEEYSRTRLGRLYADTTIYAHYHKNGDTLSFSYRGTKKYSSGRPYTFISLYKFYPNGPNYLLERSMVFSSKRHKEKSWVFDEYIPPIKKK